jgi:protoporphyrinogen oxidase
LNILFSGGLREIGRIGLDLVRARSGGKKVVSFSDFAIQRFGKTLAERFLLNYTSKVWGLPADQLSPAVATRRLSGMSLRSLVTELLTPSRRVSHLDGQFLYPRGGYGRIVEAMAAQVPNGQLQTEQEVVGLDVEAGLVSRIHLAGRRVHAVQGPVVSTLPLNLLVNLLGESVPRTVHELSRGIRFRHVRLLFLRLDQPRFSENASIYIPDPEIRISRVFEPKNRCETMSPANETAVVLEIPCFREDETGRLDEESLFRDAVDHLEELGLLSRNRVLEWRHHVLSNAYPVYSLDYAERVQSIMKSVAEPANLEVLGRNGLFFYSHLHDQLRFAKDYVAALCRIRRAI